MLEFLRPTGFLEAEPPYWYALVRPDDLPAGSYDGVPRGAEEGAETRVIVFEPAGYGIEGGVFVSRYDASCGYIGDSWYPTREAAVTDLENEFGDSLVPWTPVPAEEEDAERYVLTIAAKGRAG